MKIAGTSIVIMAIAIFAIQNALGFPINNTTDYEAWVGGHTTYGENHTRVKPHKVSSMGGGEGGLLGQVMNNSYNYFGGVISTIPGDPKGNVTLRPLSRPAYTPGYPSNIVIKQDPDGVYAIHDSDEPRWPQYERDAIEKERREKEAQRKQQQQQGSRYY